MAEREQEGAYRDERRCGRNGKSSGGKRVGNGDATGKERRNRGRKKWPKERRKERQR